MDELDLLFGIENITFTGWYEKISLSSLSKLFPEATHLKSLFNKATLQMPSIAKCELLGTRQM